MCVGYLDPCSKGEHDWEKSPEANFRHCKRCGLVQYLDNKDAPLLGKPEKEPDVESSEQMSRDFAHELRSLKWKKRAIDAGKLKVEPLEYQKIISRIFFLESYLVEVGK